MWITVASSPDRLLAVIPARGGSKGLPGKNVRPFAGLPLIAHSILFARGCQAVTKCVVSTDSKEIADTARSHGADVPFVRPAELSQDDTPLWPVLRHALEFCETREKAPYDYVLLLDPTTPCRLPAQVSEAFERLQKNSDAEGIIAVSKPDFNPIWHSVIEKDGWLGDLFPEAAQLHRRQEAPVVYRINGSFYIWRAAFLRAQPNTWRGTGKHLMYEVADFSAISIDTEEEFNRAELFVVRGLFPLPWLEKTACVP